MQDDRMKPVPDLLAAHMDPGVLQLAVMASHEMIADCPGEFLTGRSLATL